MRARSLSISAAPERVLRNIKKAVAITMPDKTTRRADPDPKPDKMITPRKNKNDRKPS
jgi:hypothetical protein